MAAIPDANFSKPRASTVFRLPFAPLFGTGILVALLDLACAVPGLVIPDFYEPYRSQRGIAAAATFMQDLSLLGVACLLAGSLFAARRGSVRALPLWAGSLAFSGYYIAFYAFDKLYTPVYPLYIALLGLSVWSLVGLLRAVDPAGFAAKIGAQAPFRLAACVLFSSALFVPLWLILLVSALQSGIVPPMGTVFVLDLAFLIPATLYAGILAWKRRVGAAFLVGSLLVKAVLSGLVLAGGTVYLGVRGQGWSLGELAVYLVLALPGALALGLFLRSIQTNSVRQLQ